MHVHACTYTCIGLHHKWASAVHVHRVMYPLETVLVREKNKLGLRDCKVSGLYMHMLYLYTCTSSIITCTMYNAYMYKQDNHMYNAYMYKQYHHMYNAYMYMYMYKQDNHMYNAHMYKQDNHMYSVYTCHCRKTL